MHALFGERRAVPLLVDPVVAGLLDLLGDLALLALDELRHDAVDERVELDVRLRRARDDQRRARLVDQDRVDLVDDREVERALDLLRVA